LFAVIWNYITTNGHVNIKGRESCYAPEPNAPCQDGLCSTELVRQFLHGDKPSVSGLVLSNRNIGNWKALLSIACHGWSGLACLLPWRCNMGSLQLGLRDGTLFATKKLLWDGVIRHTHSCKMSHKGDDIGCNKWYWAFTAGESESAMGTGRKGDGQDRRKWEI